MVWLWDVLLGMFWGLLGFCFILVWWGGVSMFGGWGGGVVLVLVVEVVVVGGELFVVCLVGLEEFGVEYWVCWVFCVLFGVGVWWGCGVVWVFVYFL